MKRSAVRWYKQGHPCVDCGISDPDILTFDHIRGNKKFTIASGYNAYKLSDIMKEIDKCVVRCFNCHMKKSVRNIDPPIISYHAQRGTPTQFR